MWSVADNSGLVLHVCQWARLSLSPPLLFHEVVAFQGATQIAQLAPVVLVPQRQVFFFFHNHYLPEPTVPAELLCYGQNYSSLTHSLTAQAFTVLLFIYLFFFFFFPTGLTSLCSLSYCATSYFLKFFAEKNLGVCNSEPSVLSYCATGELLFFFF